MEDRASFKNSQLALNELEKVAMFTTSEEGKKRLEEQRIWDTAKLALRELNVLFWRQKQQAFLFSSPFFGARHSV